MDKLLIDRVLIGGNHLASSLLQKWPPTEIKDYDTALLRCGQPYADMWVAWRAIMDLSEAQQHKQSEHIDRGYIHDPITGDCVRWGKRAEELWEQKLTENQPKTPLMEKEEYHLKLREEMGGKTNLMRGKSTET